MAELSQKKKIHLGRQFILETDISLKTMDIITCLCNRKTGKICAKMGTVLQELVTKRMCRKMDVYLFCRTIYTVLKFKPYTTLTRGYEGQTILNKLHSSINYCITTTTTTI